MMIATIQPYIQIMRLHKPIGIYLLLWPTLQALYLASNGAPDFFVLLIFSVGVIVMRSAGCVINDIADRKIDKYVARTKQRPLAVGALTTQQAFMLFFGLSIVAFILVLQLRIEVVLMSVVAILLAIIYPYTKRFHNYPQLILGIAFAWSIPMAYMQIRGVIPKEAWVVFASTICWIIAYDTLYAMVDKDDDLKIGIKSSAISFGAYDKVSVLLLQILFLLGYLFLGYKRGLGLSFYFGLFAGSILFCYQQILIKRRDRNKCFKAFLNNNYIGAIVLGGLVLSMQ